LVEVVSVTVLVSVYELPTLRLAKVIDEGEALKVRLERTTWPFELTVALVLPARRDNNGSPGMTCGVGGATGWATGGEG
jgi:hypothetical protein